ncbi:response regulator [Halostagnicola sp. A-GB9-2]|uniref:response regulator n=1 Tax=Halostagnicola sp. A-GB9-2 TaxID=3048066 RepID=UPI0024BF7378|nr:response regulator [Halostagnicola sp. A-GB9-2]MDJ1432000.1 response regulator [Halostagnicola sp. A-GB9-2]
MSGNGLVTRSDPIRVLHVDDDEALVDLAAIFLERESDLIEVTTESSVEDALDVLDAQPIDCVISDYDMPGHDGLEFLEFVRARSPDLPFILFTGKPAESLETAALRAGATEFRHKGTDADQYTVLAQRITEAVGN